MNAALAELAAEVERRQKGETADRSPRFLFVFGVHRFRELRKAEDDFGFKPSTSLRDGLRKFAEWYKVCYNV
jgi:nucleoside-diphosphate-sugar epimerase